MSIDEQINNLKEIGLIIEDESYAKKILNDISYFRLIKAYSLNLKAKNGKYDEGITFNQIVELYLFNANLRQILFAQIERDDARAFGIRMRTGFRLPWRCSHPCKRRCFQLSSAYGH